MVSDIDDMPPTKSLHAAAARVCAGLVAILAVGFFAAGVGFVGYLAQLRGAEVKPERQADGIVVLTGGSSRVSDAMDLLAGGYGQRVLVSRVDPTHRAHGIPPPPPGKP